MKSQQVKFDDLTLSQANSVQITALNAILSGMLYEMSNEQLTRVSGRVRDMIVAFDEFNKTNNTSFWPEMRNTVILTINTAIPGCIEQSK